MENMEIKTGVAEFYKGKTVLVTGDTGFKGSWLAFWLTKLGAKVIGYALPPLLEEDHFNLLNLDQKIIHIDADLKDLKRLKEVFSTYRPEIVFHLAAQALVRYSYQEPKLTFDTNVGGSVNILEAIRHTESVKAVIYVTSDKAYKNKEWDWGYRENDELGGHDPYSASKAAAELVFSSYVDSFFSNRNNIGLASVRAGNVIGGGDWAEDRIVPDCIRALSSDAPIVIRSPNATRPWQHVLEPLFGYLLLASKLYNSPGKYSGAWNFGPNIKSIKTVKELAEEVVGIFGKGVIKIRQNKDDVHEATTLHLNCDKSNLRLNWYPTWDFYTTIQETVNWYKGYLEGDNPVEITTNDINKFMEEHK